MSSPLQTDFNDSLSARVALSKPAVPADAYADEPLYAVVEIEPHARASSSESRAPLNIVLVVDSSGTMHHFQLTDEEREYWLGLAISRDEMERGEADESDAVYWTGQTLAEMQSVARKPMSLVTEAIKNLLVSLLPTDRASVIVFADTVHTLFSASDWVTFPDQCLLQLDSLREQKLPVDIGTGTRMAQSLLDAREALTNNTLPGGVNRLIVISDGIVQDADETLVNMAAIQEEGFAITTIGVGEEFDEEFLMRAADNSARRVPLCRRRCRNHGLPPSRNDDLRDDKHHRPLYRRARTGRSRRARRSLSAPVHEPL